MADGLMGTMVIVAPILLLAIIAFVVLNNRSKKVSEAETERATDRLYDEIDADKKAGDI